MYKAMFRSVATRYGIQTAHKEWEHSCAVPSKECVLDYMCAAPQLPIGDSNSTCSDTAATCWHMVGSYMLNTHNNSPASKMGRYKISDISSVVWVSKHMFPSKRNNRQQRRINVLIHALSEINSGPNKSTGALQNSYWTSTHTCKTLSHSGALLQR